MQELQRQRLFGTALGYEDINDPDYGETPAGLAGRSGAGLKE